jgi:hypothetical protein
VEREARDAATAGAVWIAKQVDGRIARIDPRRTDARP